MTDFETHPIGTAAKLAAYEARSAPMTDLRKRLAEVLAMPTDSMMDDLNRSNAARKFIRDPALARALEDAERVPELQSALSAAEAERREYEQKMDYWRDKAKETMAERDALRAFHKAFASLGEHLFHIGGMPLVDLYNTAIDNAREGKE